MCSVVEGIFGRIQVAANRQRVMLDVEAQPFDDGACLKNIDRACAGLSLSAAVALRACLDEAIAHAAAYDPRQPGLWSEGTVRSLAEQFPRRRHVHQRLRECV